MAAVKFVRNEAFSSYKELCSKVSEFEKSNFVKLYKRSSRTIESTLRRAPKRKFKSEIVYSELDMACIHGGKSFVSKSTGKRPSTSTFQMHCPFIIKLRASQDGEKLIVTAINCEHNHDVSEATFRHLPQQRKMDPEDKDKVLEMLRMKANKKLVQQHIRSQMGHIVVLKDLHNMCSKGKEARPVDLLAIVDELKKSKASGAASAVGSFHVFQNFQRKSVLAESFDNDIVKQQDVPDLDLELKQVQVFHRHGARTPLHVLEGFRQVPYDVDLVMRPHPFTLFPYERISSHTGLPIDWGKYEYRLRRKNPLNGGSIPGHLTSYGQEQMYSLGLRIRDAYGEKLGLSTFDPKHFYVLSTNINRTVESTRCVIAGIYGNDQLQDYASKHGPLPILVSESFNNILVPDTTSCSILRQVNHAAMLHFDFAASMKTDREAVEKHIDEVHDLHQNELIKAQERFKTAFTTYNNKVKSSYTSTSCPSISYNEDRQICSYDKQLQESIRDRNEAADKVIHLWHNVIAHHPTLSKLIPKDELKALLHLRKLEVEEFQLKLESGCRFKFHFDANPYFHNKEICKEIRCRPDGTLVSSNVTDIKWKPKGKQFNRSSDEVSLFSWLADKTASNSDTMSQGLKESWRAPLDFYRHVSYKMDHSTTKKINFVFLFDDMKARVTHGWNCPEGLDKFFPTAIENGTRMMFYAMTGRHHLERPVITRLAVGRLLLDMVDRAEGAMKGTNPQRVCLYSSHDSTMVSLLESLGLWQDSWPPFGADLRLEIYEDRKSSQFYVKVLLLGKGVKLRGQETELIRWENFRQVVGPYLIDQEKFDKICASNFLEEVAKDVLEHEEGEVPEAKKSKSISETPAGM